MPNEQELITGLLGETPEKVAKKLYGYSGEKAHKMIAAYVKKASAQQVTDTLNAYVAYSISKDDLRTQQDKQKVLENALSGFWDKKVFPLGSTPDRNKTAGKAVLTAWRAPDVERADAELQPRKAAVEAAVTAAREAREAVKALETAIAAAAREPAAAGAGGVASARVGAARERAKVALAAALAALTAAREIFRPARRSGQVAEGQAIREAQDDFDAAQARYDAQVATNTSEADIANVQTTRTQEEEAEEGDPGDVVPGGRRRRKTRKSKGKKRTTRRAKKRSAVRRNRV